MDGGYEQLLSLFSQSAPKQRKSAPKKRRRGQAGAEVAAEGATPEGAPGADEVLLLEAEVSGGADSARAASKDPDDAVEIGEEGAAEGEDGDEDAEERVRELEENRWKSAAYDAHYGAEWTTAELDERKRVLTDAKWELPGEF